MIGNAIQGAGTRDDPAATPKGGQQAVSTWCPAQGPNAAEGRSAAVTRTPVVGIAWATMESKLPAKVNGSSRFTGSGGADEGDISDDESCRTKNRFDGAASNA